MVGMGHWQVWCQDPRDGVLDRGCNGFILSFIAQGQCRIPASAAEGERIGGAHVKQGGSFITQGQHGIYARGAAGRPVARDQGHHREQQRHGDDGEWVGGAQAE